MFFLFTLLSMSFKTLFKVKSVKSKKIVLLKSPFHFKIAKHHIFYSYFLITFQIKLNFFFFKKLHTFFKYYFFNIKCNNIELGNVLFLKNLFL